MLVEALLALGALPGLQPVDRLPGGAPRLPLPGRGSRSG
jgi:hypothetical protein